MKEGREGDNLAIAWQYPGQSREVIPARFSLVENVKEQVEPTPLPTKVPTAKTPTKVPTMKIETGSPTDDPTSNAPTMALTMHPTLFS